MSTADSMKRRVEEECDVPDSWSVLETAPKGAIEISEFEGEGIEEAAIELINGRTVAEVVLHHANMPGRVSARVEGGLDALDEPATEIPSQVGVLQFANTDDAIKAINQLVNPDILAEITDLRSPLETEDPLSVREAVSKVTEVDMSTVDETITSI
ncbi:hypothetical protein [Natrinema halophilum]|uniref:hypothetical protein n=1 Tax=Natrinema halophilum TaxID=1699371 RepID=UPI001F42E42B|nr:hypothetical protein [Natrinema halophilum]UHQ96450.1 hypothetical protein HYG82_23710 [Natrinema halophilum]